MQATRVGAGPRQDLSTYVCSRCGIVRPRHSVRTTGTCRDCLSILALERRKERS